jgi:hypothetical protein
MATYTVHDRGRLGKESRPYTFTGTLEVLHTSDNRIQHEHVAVYRRDDGQYVVEFKTQGLLRGDLVGDSYAIVAPEDLRRVIVGGCSEPQARTVARQLGFEIAEGRRR